MTLAMNFNRTSAEGQKKPSRARANGLPDHVASFSSFSLAVRSCVVRLDVSRMGNKHKIAFYESKKNSRLTKSIQVSESRCAWVENGSLLHKEFIARSIGWLADSSRSRRRRRKNFNEMFLSTCHSRSDQRAGLTGFLCPQTKRKFPFSNRSNDS